MNLSTYTIKSGVPILGQKANTLKSYFEKYKEEVNPYTTLITLQEKEDIENIKQEIQTQKPNKVEISLLAKTIKVNFLPPKMEQEDLGDFYDNLKDHLMNYHADIGKAALDTLIKKQPYCPMPYDLINACDEEKESMNITLKALEHITSKHEKEFQRRQNPLTEQKKPPLTPEEVKEIEKGFEELKQLLTNNLKRIPHD